MTEPDPSTIETQARLSSLGMLVAGVAHEISNPLGYVRSNTEYLQSVVAELLAGDLEPGRVRVALEEFRSVLSDNADGVGRLVAIASELKRVARGGDQSRTCDLEEVIERALVLTHNLVRYKADVVREFEHPPEVLADEGRMCQVFVNLLTNAAQAIPEHGRIRLRTWVDGDRACATCEDTGTGIAAEALARLWDPFFTTKPPGVGTGLGLWAVRRFVEGAGGVVEVDSTPGRGTSFTVRLLLAPL